jgi:hypothetical protein
MATQSAVTEQEHLQHQLDDALADQFEQGDVDIRDETKSEALRREARDAWIAEKREQLADVRSRRRVYRELALRWHALPSVPFRILCYYLEQADSDLDNVFPSRKTAAAVLGLHLPAYDWHVRWLKQHGWMRTHEFRRGDGTQSSSGIQLGIPFPSEPWWGPTRFSKRKRVTRRAVSRRATNGTPGDLLTARQETY